MEKLREIKLPTLHAKEWATIAITAFLTVVSTLYVTFRTTNTAINERNEKEKDQDPISNDIEENFKTLYENENENAEDDLLTNWLGTRKNFHMIITDEEVRSSYLSLKEKLQQIDIEEQNDINDKVNHEDNNNISNNVNEVNNVNDNEKKYQSIGTYYYAPEKQRQTNYNNNKTPSPKATTTKQQEDIVPFYKQVYYGNPMNAAFTPSTTTQLSGEYNSLNVDPDIYVKLEEVSPNAWRMQMTPTPLKLSTSNSECKKTNNSSSSYCNNDNIITNNNSDCGTPSSHHHNNENKPTRRSIKFTPTKTLANTSKNNMQEDKEKIMVELNSPSSAINNTSNIIGTNKEDGKVVNMEVKSTSKRYTHVPLFSPAKAKPLPNKHNDGRLTAFKREQQQKRRQYFSPSSHQKENMVTTTPTSGMYLSTPIKGKSTSQRKKITNVTYGAPTPNRLR